MAPASSSRHRLRGSQRSNLPEAALHLTVQPVAAIVAAELAQKLDTPGLMLNFDKLFASDLFG